MHLSKSRQRMFPEILEQRALFASVSGTVFHDFNANLVQDGGEAGLSGVQLFLDLDSDTFFDAGEPAATTDASGGYAITGVPAGSYKLRQSVPATFLQLAPVGGFVSLTLGAGDNLTGRNFADAHPAKMSGTVFNDQDADGTRDAGEPGLNGIRLFLDRNGNGTFENVEAFPANNSAVPLLDGGRAQSLATATIGGGTIIDVNVSLTITHPNDGDLTVWLVSPSGTRVEVFSNVGGSGNNFQNTTFTDDSQSPIGNASAPFDSGPTGSKRFRPEGLLLDFVHENANGTWKLVVDDAAGNGTGTINRWSLWVRTGDFRTLSQSDGTWSLPALFPEVETMRSLPNSGFHVTTPPGGAHVIPLTSGTLVPNLDFGHSTKTVATGNISGTFYEDLDFNGLDAGDTLVGNKTAYIDANRNGLFDGGERTATTNASGLFTFTGLAPGIYRVRRTLPTGVRLVTPASGYYEANVTSGTTQTGKDFGTTITAKVAGIVFNDLDADGVKDAGESVLAGWRVFVDDNNNGLLDGSEKTVLSKADGGYNFIGAGGFYRVRVIPESGWTATVPASAVQNPFVSNAELKGGVNFGFRLL